MIVRCNFTTLIQDIERTGVSLYKLAALVEYRLGKSFQYVQIERVKSTGRCEHFIGEILREIHADLVPREALQNVPRHQAMEMRMA